MSDKNEGNWLAPAAAALSIVACYGTLAAVALLGALGVTIALNETVWSGAILLFAGLTLAALMLQRRRRLAPIALAGVGVLLIGFAMLISYARLIELAGFTFLCAGTLLDWHNGHRSAGTDT